MNKICVVHQSLGGGLFGAVLASADHHFVAPKDHLETAAKWQNWRFPIASMQFHSNCRQRPYNHLVSTIFAISKNKQFDLFSSFWLLLLTNREIGVSLNTKHVDGSLTPSLPQFDLFSCPCILPYIAPITSWQPTHQPHHCPQQGMTTLSVTYSCVVLKLCSGHSNL